MSRTRAADANNQILRALGITQRNIVAADICLRPGQLPRFTVDCLADPATMLHEVLAFDLVPRDPVPAPEPAPPLDLDAMCAAARERLAASTNLSADWALAEWRTESDAIHVRMNKALRHRRQDTAYALFKLEHGEPIKHYVRHITESFAGLGAAFATGAQACGGASAIFAGANGALSGLNGIAGTGWRDDQ